ncbi:MAG TPA: AEC family transporter [Bacillales bacterium]|nr:AEC family transporter [Bacillales bacterium]
MNLFFEVVLPVLLVFLAGFGLQKWKKLNIQSVSTVALYVFTPCLVFRTIYQKELNFQYLEVLIFSLLLLIVLITVVKVTSIIKKYPQSTESGLILSTAFMNSGNYGSPVVLFAFGKEGFAFAIMFFVLQAIIMNFFGVYYAARGKAGIKTALRSVFKMPATYALLVGLLVKMVDLSVPKTFFSIIDLMADAAIPCVMLVLGLQLAEISLRGFRWGKITYAAVVRLLVSPIIAWAITLILPMDPLLEKVLIVLCAMPSAATTTMYAVQFDSEPQLVSSITLVSTLASIVTVTAVLVLV